MISQQITYKKLFFSLVLFNSLALGIFGVHFRHQIYARFIFPYIPQYNPDSASKFNPQKSLLCREGVVNPESAQEKTYNLLFLGNSIALSAPSGEWKGRWGMAASTLENSYPSLVSRTLSSRRDASVRWKVCNVTPFVELARIPDHQPLKNVFRGQFDAVVIQLGDNVSRKGDSDFYLRFSKRMMDILNLSKSECNVVASTFWKSSDELQDSLLGVAERSESVYADISSIIYNTSVPESFFARSEKNWSYGIGLHPGDKGMTEIARRISIAIGSCLS